MYRVTKFEIYRNKGQIVNEVTRDAFFTSKRKAVDKVREFAEGIEEAVDKYKDYIEGRKYAWKDVFVSLWVYEESEGRLVRTASHRYKEVMDGELRDSSQDAFFEIF